MGARDLLDELTRAGLTVTPDGDRLVVRPAARLTDALRNALRGAKLEVLALLTEPARPYRLSRAEADAAHAVQWDDAACGRFATRVTLFLRCGFSATDADDLAERLHLRDVDDDDRRTCLECAHRDGLRCCCDALGRPRIGRDDFVMLRRCPGSRRTKSCSDNNPDRATMKQ